MGHACYLSRVMEPEKLQVLANQILTTIEPMLERGEIDSIACVGISGMIISSCISFLTGLPLLILRKEGETHSSHQLESPDHFNLDTCKYIIIDDLISTGETINTLILEISKRTKSQMKLPVLIILYDYTHSDKYEYPFTGFRIPVIQLGEED